MLTGNSVTSLTYNHTFLSFREAVEHFLTALDLQRQADTPPGTKIQMSEGIWSTLRLALLYLGRHDILNYVDQRDIDKLLQEFKVSHL